MRPVDAYDDVLAIGILGGIEEQFADATKEIQMTGMDLEVVRHVSIELDGQFREEHQRSIYALTCQVITEHLIVAVGIKFLGSATYGTVEEHEDHTAKHQGVVAHHIGDALRLFLRQAGLALFQHLREAYDDIEWGAHLM